MMIETRIITALFERIFYCTKYKSGLNYKIVYNYIIPYLTALIIINLEILENPKNNILNF